MFYYLGIIDRTISELLPIMCDFNHVMVIAGHEDSKHLTENAWSTCQSLICCDLSELSIHLLEILQETPEQLHP